MHIQLSVFGSAKKNTKAFTNGTYVVTHHQVKRHMATRSHKEAMLLDNSTSSLNTPLSSNASLISKDVYEAYLKLMRTAYDLAMHPALPHNNFEVLVKVQRVNGVKLLQGKNYRNTAVKLLIFARLLSFYFLARELIKCIATTITEKIAAIVVKKSLISLLSDGSQVRKTGSEKEAILVRVEHAGGPCYFFVSLRNMTDFGGSDANSLKLALDSVFITNNVTLAKIPFSTVQYRTKLISATADGANVNMSIYNGALTQLKATRPWLVNIHCVNHRLELAIKDAMNQFKEFSSCDNLYTTLFYLLKNSSKLKESCKHAAASLSIQYYALNKITGTRFAAHRQRGFTKLLHNWPSYLLALPKTLANKQGYRNETRSKLQGIFKKKTNYAFLCYVGAYVDLLDAMTPMSLFFKKNVLIAHEVQPQIDLIINNLTALTLEVLDEAFCSSIRKFPRKEENGMVFVESCYLMAGHKKRKSNNKKYLDIKLDGMIEPKHNDIKRAFQLRKQCIDILIPLINSRFKSFNDNLLFDFMKWLDPQYWTNEQDSSNGIKYLMQHFQEPLANVNFQEDKVFGEWDSVQILVKARYSKLTCLEVWHKLWEFGKAHFPNILQLAELCFCLSSSNSTVERCFSTLITILSENRLQMSHSTIEECMLIVGNDHVWSDEDRNDILKQAVNQYLEKRRTVKFQSETEIYICENQKNSNESSVETVDSDNSVSDCELLDSEEEDIENDDTAHENNKK
nr:zinc finger protein 862-like [Hydra vulgaris]